MTTKTLITGLNSTQEVKRSFRVHLKSKLKRDSDGVNYNLRGSVIWKKFVALVERVEAGYDIIELVDNVKLHPQLITASNTGRECFKFYINDPNDYLFIGREEVDKIETTETTTVILTP